MINKKAKGTNAERELISLFWKNGFAALRAAGSGSSRYPCPDIIAANRVRKLGIECKTTSNLKKYLLDEDINQLSEFCRIFGAEPWIAVRFNVLKWYFLTLEDLEKTKKGYLITIENAKNKGLIFEELINESTV